MSDSESKYFGEELQGLSEAAPILAEKYNKFARRCPGYEEITEEEMTLLLEKYVDAKEFHHGMATEFSQGILVGKILTTHDTEYYLMMAGDGDED